MPNMYEKKKPSDSNGLEDHGLTGAFSLGAQFLAADLARLKGFETPDKQDLKAESPEEGRPVNAQPINDVPIVLDNKIAEAAIAEERAALDPAVNDALNELYDEEGQLREHCLSLEAIMALSQPDVLGSSPHLKQYMKEYFDAVYVDEESFRNTVLGLIDSSDPENATDLLVMASRFADPAKQQDIEKIAQEAFARMAEKAKTSPRYGYEASLLQHCLPFELDFAHEHEEALTAGNDDDLPAEDGQGDEPAPAAA